MRKLCAVILSAVVWQSPLLRQRVQQNISHAERGVSPCLDERSR
ncbi:hypothetical protein ECH7EC4113_5370 [Escherichia coli O157:H7 str. EC4113]|nr:hypothetical protein ECH7EC4113_5370 [Escherichia coli O157:H7 str. EC4113]